MLEIQNLTSGYASGFFLREINLKVNDKEVMGIIGPNGSGKTTLLRSIMRLLKPKKGRIILNKKDIWQIGLKELAQKVAAVTQDPGLNSMTIEDFVLLGRIPYFSGLQFLETRQDLEISRRAMHLTGTLKFKDRRLDEISQGERQLALIARALAQEPQLLLLDEPTAHLDIAHQVAILDLIKRLNRELGLTVIMVLHDLNLASEYCQRLALINNGLVHKMGLAEEVLQYQLIEEVYKTTVVVERNPISCRPYVLLVSQEEKQRGEERINTG